MTFDSRETVAKLAKYYGAHVKLTPAARASVMTAKDDPWGTLMLTFFAAEETARSFGLLAHNRRVRDSFVTARTLVETIINIGFIAAGGAPVADKAWRHTLQKAYRDLKRELKINGRVLHLEYSVRTDPQRVPGLQAALEEYTTRSGRERTNWTDEDIRERIECIDRTYGAQVSEPLMIAFMAVYRHASEIAHGTHFGVMFGLGMLQAPYRTLDSVGEVEAFQNKYLGMLYVVLAGALDSLFRIVHATFAIPDVLAELEKQMTILQSILETDEGAA